jgi:hypothetical protein
MGHVEAATSLQRLCQQSEMLSEFIQLRECLVLGLGEAEAMAAIQRNAQISSAHAALYRR